MDKIILSKFLNAGFSYKKKLFPTDNGTAQGSPISPILANMTLDGMEHIIAKKYWINSAGNIDKKHKNKKKVNLIRLADDFIITTIDKETAVEVKEIIKGFLLERGLILSEEKTQITNIEDGFDFLGWNFRKYNGKLIIKPSKKSANKIRQTVSKNIKENKTAKQESLIRILNPIITGWANYHQSVCAKQTFSKIDHIIWNMLWKWCKRRHTNKSKAWVKKRYWHKLGNRDWVFKDGELILERASDKPIVRHISLKLDKNPFLHAKYFEQRRSQQKYNKIEAYVETTAAQIRSGLLNA